ncbi:MAG: hypothetical protein ACI8X5_001509 [Planctomycetota bacterium]|jgi:hypothetical protein
MDGDSEGRRQASNAVTSSSVAQNSESIAFEGPTSNERAAHLAIERGLKFLAAQQAAESDGSIPSAGDLSSRLAVTALSALAFMSAGNLPDRGPHGAELARSIDYLISRTDQESSSRSRGYISDGGDAISRMHGHGFATLALAEAHCASPTSFRGSRLVTALESAVHLIEATQGHEGGWYYEPVREIQHEGSITIALVQALRAAKGAGIGVDKQVIAKAVDYVRRSQADDGGFRYSLGDGKVTPALTAAAISTLNAAGKYHGPEVQQGYDYLDRELRARDVQPVPSKRRIQNTDLSYTFYERFYIAQAYWQNPDRSIFDNWMREERSKLLRTQNENGAWTDRRYGDTYATAINVLVLALPDQLLPIFQR